MPSQQRTARPWWPKATASVLLALLFLLQTDAPPPLSTLERIQSSGELRILSRNGPTTYYEDNNQGLEGFEYRLSKAFADYIGVALVIDEEEDLGNIFSRVKLKEAAYGAAGLTITPERQQRVRFSSPYLEVTQQLLYRSGSKRPRNIEDLYGKDILVIANSAHAEQLKALQKDHPELQWREEADVEMIDLMEMVHDGNIDFTVVDSNAYGINRTIYPRAKVAFELSEAQSLAWAFPQSADQSLYQAAESFLQHANDSGLLADINEYFYGHVDESNARGALTFTKRVESRLPRWKDFMKEAAENYELDWRLLAAISYQESHWNPRAKSYTGVRGLMMLTLNTAKEMGVKNRLDPKQSINGGARYFKSLYNRLPSGIVGQDRKWMTLAAYNIGLGHLEDARVLTQRQGGDPNRWNDVKERLPLLAKRKYYRTTKHGYARGWEPVKYVRKIRSYYATLAWYDQIEMRRMASADEESGIESTEASSINPLYNEYELMNMSLL